MKNWKSSSAFITFMLTYIYVIYSGSSEGIVSTVGYLLLYAMAFIMVRSDTLNTVVIELAEGFKGRISK